MGHPGCHLSPALSDKVLSQHMECVYDLWELIRTTRRAPPLQVLAPVIVTVACTVAIGDSGARRCESEGARVKGAGDGPRVLQARIPLVHHRLCSVPPAGGVTH
ncbi:hypothetical protein AAFF_G00019190 [Aldrovandia affinis]|uniref:Uncharacterized protein n=1 Tax=Aldrovandia affinis TaxID=143900 RepID=A0AAD7WGP9_9TELE|nr:hypothetical protein AAFF_G00019190 [Aldrovandia affinis]